MEKLIEVLNWAYPGIPGIVCVGSRIVEWPVAALGPTPDARELANLRDVFLAETQTSREAAQAMERLKAALPLNYQTAPIADTLLLALYKERMGDGGLVGDIISRY